MAPPPSGATAAARRAAAAPQSRPSTRRAPLRVFVPEPRRSSRRRASRRAHVWLAVALVVGSLLVVVAGDTVVAQGQVRLSALQSAITAEQATQKSMQTDVAQLAAPDRVVAQGIALGLTAPAQVLDLPEVPLDVPLPVPQTAAPAGTAPAATTPAATAPAATTPAGTTATATTVAPSTASTGAAAAT